MPNIIYILTIPPTNFAFFERRFIYSTTPDAAALPNNARGIPTPAPVAGLSGLVEVGVMEAPSTFGCGSETGIGDGVDGIGSGGGVGAGSKFNGSGYV